VGPYTGAVYRFWGIYIGILISLTGVALVISGWKQIHKEYWSKEEGKEKLVTTGIYRYIRHPQYTGFYMITFGMMCEWATLPLIILYCLLLALYYKLAKTEEADIEKEFGKEYVDYKKTTKMFIPYIL
jgi:methanethiol S-methyltransferase